MTVKAAAFMNLKGVQRLLETLWTHPHFFFFAAAACIIHPVWRHNEHLVYFRAANHWHS